MLNKTFNSFIHRCFPQAARILQEAYSLDMPILVDGMDDSLCRAYAAMPERFYIILEGKVLVAGDQGPAMYDLRALEDWIKNHWETRN